jgi:hypothetical protein
VQTKVKDLVLRKAQNSVLMKVEVMVSRVTLTKVKHLVQKRVKHFVKRKAQNLVLMKVEATVSSMAL